MSTRSSGLLTNVFKPVPVMVKRRPRLDDLLGRTGEDEWQGPQVPARRRTRLWEINESLHCSIIGTCLSTGELRRILVRLRVDGAETRTDHECHNAAVSMAASPDDGARFLNKALDRRHQVALHQYAKANDPAAILELWERALKQGDIPGAYWALLTHPLATESLVNSVFSDVHMLSHLVGAANRADIRRLRQFEEENAALSARLDLRGATVLYTGGANATYRNSRTCSNGWADICCTTTAASTTARRSCPASSARPTSSCSRSTATATARSARSSGCRNSRANPTCRFAPRARLLS